MLQILIYGAVSSAIYAMLAVGFTLYLRRLPASSISLTARFTHSEPMRLTC